MVVLVYNAAFSGKLRQEDCCELKGSLSNTISIRAAKATKQNTISKEKHLSLPSHKE